jgi:hypothetical protein
MYKISNTIKGLIPSIKGLTSSVYNSVYNKFHPNIMQPKIPIPKTEDVVEAIRAAYSKIEYPIGTPLDIDNSLRTMIDNQVSAQIRYEMSGYGREEGMIPFLRELYSDLKDHYPITRFFVDIVNPISDYNILHRLFIASSIALSVSLPSIISNQVKMAGSVFCQLANNEHQDECKEHLDNLSYWAYIGALGVSGGVFISSICYVAD